MRTLLFETIHGSHLYGTNHEHSDRDTFRVYTNVEGRKRARWAKQSINGDDDSLRTDLSTFLQYAQKGVPQYLEAMWSPYANYDLLGDTFRFGFVPNYAETIKTYQRTIKSFWMNGIENNDRKRMLHAFRLEHNLAEFMNMGRFNPHLHSLVLQGLRDRLDAGETPDLGEDDV